MDVNNNTVRAQEHHRHPCVWHEQLYSAFRKSSEIYAVEHYRGSGKVVYNKSEYDSIIPFENKGKRIFYSKELNRSVKLDCLKKREPKQTRNGFCVTKRRFSGVIDRVIYFTSYNDAFTYINRHVKKENRSYYEHSIRGWEFKDFLQAVSSNTKDMKYSFCEMIRYTGKFFLCLIAPIVTLPAYMFAWFILYTPGIKHLHKKYITNKGK